MPAERFSNLYETTVGSAYTSGTTTLVVASATGAPTAGVFRLRLGNAGKTIWRVDSVSGTTFTGAAEENDANASIGDAVTLVASRAVAERFLQAPTAAEIQAYAGVAGADRYGPMWKLAPLDQSGWAWTNQGGATVVQASGVVYLTAPSSGSDSYRVRSVAAPSTPYTVTALVRASYGTPTINIHSAGILFRKSSDGKLYVWYVSSGNQLQAVKWTSPTVFSAVGPVNRTLLAAGQWIFLRLEDDGTNLKFSASLDGVNFETYGTEGRTVFMSGGPDQIGIYANDAAAIGLSLSVASWVVA